MNEYLHYFFATRNIRALAALGQLTLVIPHCRTDQISRSFLSAAGCLGSLLPSGMFSGSTLSFLRSL